MKKSQLKEIIREEILNILKEDEDFRFDTGTDKKKSASYLFTVKNDDEGRKRIQTVKDNLRDIFDFRVRGRHHDRKELLGTKYQPGTQNDVPLDDAEYLAVYVDPKKQ